MDTNTPNKAQHIKRDDMLNVKLILISSLISLCVFVSSSDRSVRSGEAGGVSSVAGAGRGRGPAQQERHRPAVQRRPTGTLAGELNVSVLIWVHQDYMLLSRTDGKDSVCRSHSLPPSFLS